MRLRLVLLLAVLAPFSLPAIAQSADSTVSLDFTGNIQKTASGEGITDTATISGGFLMNYQRHLTLLPRADAIEVNGAFTTFTQYYQPGGSQTQSNVYEGSLAYVHHFGSSNGETHLRPFAEGGGAAELFSVVSTGSIVGARKDVRPAILYGVGVDWGRGSHFALRLGYRGLFYKAPDFSQPAQITGAWTHMAEPYIGVSYRY